MFFITIYIKTLLWAHFIGGLERKHFSRDDIENVTIFSENICTGFITDINQQNHKEELVKILALEMPNLVGYDEKESQSCMKKKTCLNRVPSGKLLRELFV